MTKGELFEQLKDFPDNITLWFNVEMGKDSDYNYDTDKVELMLDNYLCERCEGYHEEPLMYYNVVFMIGRRQPIETEA